MPNLGAGLPHHKTHRGIWDPAQNLCTDAPKKGKILRGRLIGSFFDKNQFLRSNVIHRSEVAAGGN